MKEISTPITRRNLARLFGGAVAASPAISALLLGAAPPPATNWAPADKKKTGMIIRSQRPEDFEMMIDGFNEDITPIERFFVRSHHYTPKVDLATWKLKVGGHVAKPLELTFEQIQKMPKVELVSVLECAGNGRSFYEPSMPGLQWEHGAVGNGKWAGVRLSEVLKLAGIRDGGVEVMFDGADVPVGTQPEFQRSIPVSKAMAEETMLAYEMNGQPLPTSHGFPLRLIVPGWAGDCWVKWLTGIQVLDKQFDGFFMKTAYRHPGKPVKPGTAVDPAQMSPVTQLVPKGVIAYPEHGSQIEAGKAINIRAVIWSGGNHVSFGKISVDGGAAWEDVRPVTYNGRWAWRSVVLTYIPQETGYMRIMLKGGDNTGAVQPHMQSWNPSGYLWNVSHSVGVEVVKEVKPVSAGGSAPAEPGLAAPASLRSTCLVCHGDDVIKQQRLTRTQWDREIDKMVRWGAKVKDSDRAAILDYLSKSFPYTPR